MFRTHRLSGWLVVLALIVSTPVVFHPLVVSGYTLSQNPYAADMARGYVDDQLPVLDPAAGAFQDEPWLYTLRFHLAQGKLPLVNLKNGLGAPFLESLQPGVFYLLNPLLALLPANSSKLFDAFSLLHVGVLVVGLYLLLRLYARREAALCVALLVGFSGVTYHHLNMVHFRGFVWLPLMLAGGIRLVRGERSLGAFVLLGFSTLAAATAGNLQDFVMSTLAFTVICVADVWASAGDARGKLRRLGAVALCFGCLGLTAAPAYLPYLVSLKDGNLATVATAPRCLGASPPVALGTWLLPAANGRLWSQQLLDGFLTFDHQPDFPTAGFLLLVTGVVLLARHRKELPPERRRMLVALFAFLAVCLAKVLHPRIFDVCASLPLLSGIRFTKYVLHNHVTAALIAALSLEGLLSLKPERRRSAMWLAAGLAGSALVALVLGLWWSPRWHFPQGVDDPVRRDLLVAWGASAGLALALAVTLLRRSRPAWGLLVLAILLQATLVRPNGYRGVLDAPRLPHASLADAERVQGRRLLTSLNANTNLLFRIEDIGVFDPIHNRALADFLSRHFTLANPAFHLQLAGAPLALGPAQLDALRFLGVEGIQPDLLSPATGLPTQGGLVPLEGALPRAFALPEAVAAEAGARCSANDLSGALGVIHRALEGREPLSVDVRTNSLRVRGPGLPERHVLVVTQAYSTGWAYQGQRGERFCDLYPSWKLDGGARTEGTIRYWPRGLTPALVLSGVALAALVGLGAFLRRGSAGGARGERRPPQAEVRQEAA